MKKYLIGLLVIFAFAVGMCSCVIVHDNDDDDDFTSVHNCRGYFYNHSDYVITSWGAVNVDSGDVYQDNDSDTNLIYPDHYNGPIYVPEGSKVKMQMMFKRDHDVYTTPDSYKVRDHFNFHLYYNDEYDWELRMAGGNVEPKPYLIDDEGNIIILEKVTEGKTIKAF